MSPAGPTTHDARRPMPYFTVDEFREQYPKLTTAEYPDDRVDAVRALAEEAIEDACGAAFEPRTDTVSLSGDGGVLLNLGRPHVRAITGATSDGATLTITGVRIVDGARLYRLGGWPAGVANLTVTYQHGYDQPPGRIRQAAMILTRAWLVDGPIDDRATALAVEGGGTVTLATPGQFGAEFGIPEVDATVRRYRWPASKIGSVSTVAAANLVRDIERP